MEYIFHKSLSPLHQGTLVTLGQGTPVYHQVDQVEVQVPPKPQSIVRTTEHPQLITWSSEQWKSNPQEQWKSSRDRIYSKYIIPLGKER